MAASPRWQCDRAAGASGAIQFHGVITDEDGRPVPNVLIETWHAAGDDDNAATKIGRPRCDGRNYTRPKSVITDQQGRYSVKMVPPLAPEHGSAPFIAVSVEARGHLDRLITRAYLPGCHLAKDSLLRRLPAERRQALIATRDDIGLRFDITLRPAICVTAETSDESRQGAVT
ncbi:MULTISPECIES: intradiol ring-cleavage dioxygenase [Mycobacteriaceae]|uniref:Intradiol ring-cleavage dioxygenase n=1 Tax=Mycolicibacterium parafortuitum TaxID=39692 RepID=A0ACC6MP42_MYCPF|nr:MULTISPECIES: intradiol ring-cleavage dioxygenase [Mycobacteriaceae]MDZ5088787.1 intradiol ring-cleavage dioxygenase [Mycolicibacterium parafortuitum]BBA72484.1 intradiol ring-cleavage dioxygenase [Mycobacterium sp. PO1]BBA72870.1 intradiol ring-cleavage dioxygenase [Mycobacterium sp. PO2]GFM18667.1 intradiol ring-cleavage dioxygenase [Mycobacterium sp. PO1]GFM22201.1 intradiol ring-cleavage dioxygenase [Mycobacterium sp. PO2]